MGETGKHNISSRKDDHIDLAFASQTSAGQIDPRFYYEPMLSAHPSDEDLPVQFLGKTLRYPIWVSSMTGGTEAAKLINTNLAQMCGAFGFGMGLGSCRILLEKPKRLPDFDVRAQLGDQQPLFANLGLAQIEKMLSAGTTAEIRNMLEMLQADGLVIHINPLQEWLQPEGDRFMHPPLETVTAFLKQVDYPVIVKEVGQGMGPESLKALLQLPLAAIELAAHGGTNFSRLELLRDSDPLRQEHLERIATIGHSAPEMVAFINASVAELGDRVRCRQIIVSGGLKDYLDGFYLMKTLTLPSIYGHASGFLKYAQQGYEQLEAFARIQTTGLKLAHSYLRVR